MLADLFTKPLLGSTFKKLRALVLNLPDSNGLESSPELQDHRSVLGNNGNDQAHVTRDKPVTEESLHMNSGSQSSKSKHNNLKEVTIRQDRIQYPKRNNMGRDKTNVKEASTCERAKGG